MTRSTLLGLICAICVLSFPLDAADKITIGEKEVVVFYGDSITIAHGYTSFVEYYLHTRGPVRLRSGGVNRVEGSPLGERALLIYLTT